MYVKVITPFFGKEEGRLQRMGDVIQVSQDRGERIIARGLAIATSEPTKPKPKSRKKRKKAKKPLEDKAERPKEDKAHLTEGVAFSGEEPEVAQEE